MPSDRPGATPLVRAFSFVEVILSLIILSLLAAIVISMYGEDTARAREDSAQVRLSVIAEAIKRWELENRRDYPYTSVGPLVGRYLDRAGNDPWDNPMSVDNKEGFVYSWGPNNVDDRGGGDDIRMPFRVKRIPTQDTIAGGVESPTTDTIRPRVATPPSPPTNLAFDLGRKELAWKAPATFADGTALDPAKHLAGYRVFKRDSKGEDVQIATATAPAYSVNPESSSEQIYTVRAFYKDRDNKIIESASSNQTGVFKPDVVAPVITRFEPNTYTPPVGVDNKNLSFRLEVFDADSNLEKVELLGFGATEGQAWPPAGKTAAEMKNRFRVTYQGYQPSGGFDLGTTGPIDGVELRAQDASGNTTSMQLPRQIVVTNTPPNIVSFRLDRSALIRGSSPETGYKTSVLATVDVQDLENNLKTVTLKREGSGESYTSNRGTIQGTFVVDTLGSTVRLVATAEDTAGAQATRPQEITIAADETPPETAQANLNLANTYLVSHPLRCETNAKRALGVNNWWLSDPNNITVTWDSFEAETPPVHYKVAISTVPPPLYDEGAVLGSPSTTWTSTFVPGAITKQLNGQPGWCTPVDRTNPATAIPADTRNTYVIQYNSNSALSDLTGPLREGVTYYMGVMAENSANPRIANMGVGYPRNPANGCPQNGFALDATPPEVGQIEIVPASPCPAYTPVINGISGLSARWPYARDNPNGSGLSSYWYTVVSRPPVGPESTVVDVRDFRATEINNLPLGNQDGRTLLLTVRARDAAGNISTTPSTLTIRVDSTPPYALRRPIITNANNGIITDPNHFEGRWDNVFVDNELADQPLSFEWGISTTQPIRGIPDRSPGGWQVAGANINGSFDQTNLLANGDTVYLVVRATNCANSTSIETYSAPAVVRTGVFARLTAVPTFGFQPLTVQFKLEIGGQAGELQGPFNFTFDFSESSSDTATHSELGTSETSVTVNHPYEIAGGHRCFGQVSTAGGSKAFALATIQVLPQPYVLVLGNNTLSVVDPVASQTLLKLPLGGSVNPSRIKLAQVSDSLKFAIFSAAGTLASPGGIYRFDLDSVEPVRIVTEGAVIGRIEATNQDILLKPGLDDIAVSPVVRNVIHVLATNRTGGDQSVVLVDLGAATAFPPAFSSYGPLIARPFSLDPAGRSAVGLPSGVSFAADPDTAVVCNREGRGFAPIFGLDLNPPRVGSTQDLGLTSAGYLALSPDGSTVAFTDRRSPRLVVSNVSLVATTGGDLAPDRRRPALGTGLQIPLLVDTSDAEIAADNKTVYAAEPDLGRIVKVDVSAGTANLTRVISPGGSGGLDLSRDGSLLVVGDASGKLRLLKTSTMEQVGTTVTLADGCRDVVFFERPSFGKPVVTRIVPSSVKAGETADVRGYNLGKVDASLKVQLVSDSASQPPTTAARIDDSVGTNGFNSVRFRVPAGFATGGTRVIVSTSLGSAESRMVISP